MSYEELAVGEVGNTNGRGQTVKELADMAIDTMNESTRTPEVELLFGGKTLGEVLQDVPGGSDAITGKIHAKEPVSRERALELAEAIRECIVWVAPNAFGRCGDGRPALRTLAGTPTTPRAGVIGGELVAGYAGLVNAGLVPESEDADEEPTPRDALEVVNTRLRNAGINGGGHVDADHEAALGGVVAPEAAQEEVNDGTGCGGNDGVKNHLRKGVDHPGPTNVVASVLDPEYDPSGLSATAESIEQHTKGWNPKDAVEITTTEGGDPTARNDAIEVLDSPHDQGVHGHFEFAHVIVRGEPDHRGYLPTFDRDKFFELTGLQAFSVTPVRFEQIADAIVAGPNQVEDAKRVRSGIARYNAGTVLNLGDGSQYVYEARV